MCDLSLPLLLLLLFCIVAVVCNKRCKIVLNELCMICHRIHWVLRQQQKLNLKITVHTSKVTLRF